MNCKNQIDSLTLEVDALRRIVRALGEQMDRLDPDKVLSTHEILDFLKIKKETLGSKYRKYKDYGLRKEGKQFFWKRSELEAYLFDK